MTRNPQYLIMAIIFFFGYLGTRPTARNIKLMLARGWLQDEYRQLLLQTQQFRWVSLGTAATWVAAYFASYRFYWELWLALPVWAMMGGYIFRTTEEALRVAKQNRDLNTHDPDT